VVDVEGSRLSHVANGVCASDGDDLAKRLLSLFVQIEAVVIRFAPEHAAVEHTFVNKDAAGTLKLGQARAMSMLVPARAGIPVAEYAPNAVKKAIVGVGHADKGQVDHMVRMMLPGVEIAGPDSADALAIALCHAHHARFQNRLSAAIAAADRR
jgi:crossover junction endodeoxyribonuclease RuvC